MERILLQPKNNNNFHASFNNFYIEVFHHMGWGGMLCLTMETWTPPYGWKAVPVADYLPGHSKERYTVGFNNLPNKTDRQQLIEFLQTSFNFDLIFPV